MAIDYPGATSWRPGRVCVRRRGVALLLLAVTLLGCQTSGDPRPQGPSHQRFSRSGEVLDTTSFAETRFAERIEDDEFGRIARPSRDIRQPVRTLPSGYAFEPVRCWANFQTKRRVDCGWLTVPRDLGAATDERLALDSTTALGPAGETFKLPVVTFKAPGPDRKADPVVFINGGPGASSMIDPMLGPVWGLLLPELSWLEGRDFIVLDQRGVGHARPSLRCPGFHEVLVWELLLHYRLPHPGLDRRGLADLHASQLPACYRALREKHGDLSGFGSPRNVSDLIALRQLLEVETWNVWGASYGSRTALLLADRAQADKERHGIRSLILESVVPPDEVDFGTEFAGFVQGLGEVLTGRCRRDPACRDAFGDPGARLARILTGLRASPQSLLFPLPGRDSHVSGKLLVDDLMFLDLVFVSIYASEGVADLPALLRGIERDGVGVLTELAQNWLLVNTGPLMNYALKWTLNCGGGEDSVTEGMEAAFQDAFGSLGEWIAWRGSMSPCAFWRSESADRPLKRPARSDLPMLILAGGLDVPTPASQAHRVAETLPNAQILDLPWAAHDASSSPCARRVLRAFLGAPTSPIPHDCKVDQARR